MNHRRAVSFNCGVSWCKHSHTHTHNHFHTNTICKNTQLRSRMRVCCFDFDMCYTSRRSFMDLYLLTYYINTLCICIYVYMRWATNYSTHLIFSFALLFAAEYRNACDHHCTIITIMAIIMFRFWNHQVDPACGSS